MECEDTSSDNIFPNLEDAHSAAAVNSSILNYYKKFGRKRDLEQYFSLSTAQSDIRDPNSLFWRSMKNQHDSSDSGDKKSESSTELCRISIKCTVPEASTSQDENTKRTPESDSPPIITEEQTETSKHSDEELEKSDCDHSQKSADATFDTSMNKPASPTSSVTSQRKLEWDSLADVGYGNESSRKASGSSLSTLERLALKQQYSNNDSRDLGYPTAHSTPFDQSENKPKAKRSTNRTTKIHRKDVDHIEVNMPHDSKRSQPQAINVNLTKHISFNVDKTGCVTVEEKNSNDTPEKVSVETEITPLAKLDRESQTSLRKTSDKSSVTELLNVPVVEQQASVPLSLNTLRRRNRKKRALRRKSKTRIPKSRSNKENEPVKQKSAEQISEAESFEYMPGHIYNQNQLRQENAKTKSMVGNKSSLESSGNVTTDSSKHSKMSFTKDLEKSLRLLKDVLKGHCDDKELKKKLVKSVVQRLLESQYRNEESSTDFLSGISYSSRKLGFGDSHHTTSSTSDTTGEKKPKKSILRAEKFNPNVIASSSQSAPNLPVISRQDIPVMTNLAKANLTTTSESDSGKDKDQLDTSKVSSEELYQKYLEALKREAAYKKHLKDKEILMRTKLVASDNAVNTEARVQNRIKELMKDLTRNNYDDGSGDASKLEGGSNTYPNVQPHGISRSQRSHSVFTLNSSAASGSHKNKWSLKKRYKQEIRHPDAECSAQPCTSSNKGIYYKVDVCDSAIQVDIQSSEENEGAGPLQPIIESAKNIAHFVSDEATGDVKYVCLCPSETQNKKSTHDNILIYKCSRLSNTQQVSVSCEKGSSSLEKEIKNSDLYQPSTSKQTEDCGIKLPEKSSQTEIYSHCNKQSLDTAKAEMPEAQCLLPPNVVRIEEATRCLQTEISINPQLAEPTVSDIHFVSDKDCAILVSEQYKIPKVLPEMQCEESKQSLTGTSKSGMKKHLQLEQNFNTDCISDFTEASQNQKDLEQYAPTISQPSASSLITNQGEIQSDHTSRHQDNIAIPIEGTNMTLMVTFSARHDLNVQSQGTVTHKPEVSEKATSLFEECTKSVQSHDINLFKEIDKLTLESNKSNIISEELDNNLLRPKFNTHPKPISIPEKRLFFRSNTDPTLVEPKPTVELCMNKETLDNANCYPVVVNHKRYSVKPLIDQFSTFYTKKSSRKTDSSSYTKPNNSSQEYESDNSSQNAMPVFPVHNFSKKAKAIISPKRIGSLWKKKTRDRDSLDDLREPILDMIKVITKRFSKSSIETKEKKRLKDIILALSHLLDTDESGNAEVQPSISRPATTNTSINTSRTSHRSSVHELKTQDPAKNPECKVVLPETTFEKRCLKSDCKFCGTMNKMDLNNEPEAHFGKDMFVHRSCRNPKPAQQLTEKAIQSPNSDKSKDSEKVTKIPLGDDLCIKIKCKKTRKPSHSKETPITPPLESNKESNRHEIDQEAQDSPYKTENEKNSEPFVVNVNYLNKTTKMQSSTDEVNSTDSLTCRSLSKMLQHDQHQQRRHRTSQSKGNASCSHPSSTCNNCKRINYCHCASKSHKYKKSHDCVKKKSIAYNLIVQTSDSISDDTLKDNHIQQLKNIIVKVPSRRRAMKNLPFQEMVSKIEKTLPRVLSYEELNPDTRFVPNGMPCSENLVKRTDVFTVRQYLETNRPQFVDKSTRRQNCIKLISEKRASQREVQRQLLSLHVDEREALSNLTIDELRQLAEQLGIDLRRKDKPKFIHEKEMKKHSENIYKTLPEVTQKKEQQKKNNMKKTNLLMADIFKKNLQKRTLQGNMNLSNYSAVLKL